MKLKKGDNVLIISGKDRGKTGKILQAFPDEAKITIEGANLRKKHQKPKKQGEKGQVISMPSPLNISNVKLICSKCSKAVRTGFKIEKSEKGKKIKSRICKKCKQEI